MTRDEFLQALDELLELESGTLRGPEKLDELETWDSLAIVSFMGMAKARCDVSLTAKSIAGCQTVDDLYRLAGSPGGPA